MFTKLCLGALVVCLVVTGSAFAAPELWVSGWDSDSISRFNTMTGTYLGEITHPGLNGTAGLALGPDGFVYAVSGIARSVLRFDPQNASFVDTFISDVDGMVAPRDLAFGPDGTLFVSDIGSHQVWEFDRKTGAFLASISGAELHRPFAVSFGPNGDLFVSSNDSQILRYDPATGEFLDVFIGGGLAVR